MSKFNAVRRSGLRSAVTSVRQWGARTHEGGQGHARDLRSELFLLAVAHLGEPSFYESAGDREDRFSALVREAALAHPQWTAELLGWLRNGAHMRTASLAGAADFVWARLAEGIQDGVSNRAVIASVLRRADEPGEMLAYWTSRHGRSIPKPVKRGVADAVRRLYTERNLLKYDTASKGFRFGDVIDLVHPSPSAPWQGPLFAHALDRRHGRASSDLSALPMLAANAALRDGDPACLLDPATLREAGMTWEDVLSLAGSRLPKRKLWESVIPSMGLMALARNLRNIDEAGVSDEVAARVAARFADPEQVAASRMFPFRWLAAYRHAPSLRWAYPLEQALTASLATVPALPGRTLVLVDVSGSMSSRMSARSELNRADAAGAFGAALALRAERVTLAWFSHESGEVRVPRGGALLPLIEAIPRPSGGTSTAKAVHRWYDRHDRVVIITDEQAAYDGVRDVTAAVPGRVPVYTWNLGGYRYGHAPSGSGNRHTFGGLTDASFRMIPLLERGRNASWPWE